MDSIITDSAPPIWFKISVLIVRYLNLTAAILTIVNFILAFYWLIKKDKKKAVRRLKFGFWMFITTFLLYFISSALFILFGVNPYSPCCVDPFLGL